MKKIIRAATIKFRATCSNCGESLFLELDIPDLEYESKSLINNILIEPCRWCCPKKKKNK